MSSTLVDTTLATSPSQLEEPHAELAAEPNLTLDAAALEELLSEADSSTVEAPESPVTDAATSDVARAKAEAVSPPPPANEELTPLDNEGLSTELERLIDSISTVEELSRQAREAAVGDLAQYESLASSSQQYVAALKRASGLEQQAAQARDRAFGRSAMAAADRLLADARRVRTAFTELADAWRERAEAFLGTHPDVELLVAEQRAEEQREREQEALAARCRRRDSIRAALSSALDAHVLSEARQAIALLEREFPDEAELLKTAQQKFRVAVRDEMDLAARAALELAADQRAAGDLEASLATLEQVDVDGLSLEVSQDVFGRWCDTCSRLAQTTGAHPVRYAPQQGRGLILLKDPGRPREMQIFSSLGMGGDFPPNATITPFLSERERRDPAARRRAAAAERILRGARDFRDASLDDANWTSYGTSLAGALTHH